MAVRVEPARSLPPSPGGAGARPWAEGARQPAVRVHGVSHAYPARAGGLAQALARVDLVAQPGELVAVLGPSGCGKSTLLRIVAGLLRPTSGSVEVGGAGVGWLAQEDGLLPWRSVLDNVLLPLRVGRGREATSHRGAALALLEQVGLTDSARRYPHELSGGMRQRAALARALVARPGLLLLDEPFAHLDELTRERLGDLLLALQGQYGPTTLLVTHSTVEAVRLADRVLVLSSRPGRVLADVPIPLTRPRRYDQPGFGQWVQRLKELLWC